MTKRDWHDHYEASEQIETLGMHICDLEIEIESLDEVKDAEEIKNIAAVIVDYEEEIKELRKNIIPTTPEGDSIESLQE